MIDLNKKPAFSRSSRPSSSDRNSTRNPSRKFSKENESKLVWKQNNSTPNIRMMTMRQGVSERVMHEQPCKILEKCGSCPSLDLAYKTQLQQKTADFKSRLLKAGDEFQRSIVKDCIESEEKFGYKHHVKMVASEHSGLKSSQFSNFANPKRWIDLGVYNQSSNEVVDTGRCPIQTNVMNDISAYIRTGIRVHNVSVYTPKQKDGLLHCVILRSSHYTRQAQVTFVVTKADLNLLRPFARDISEKFTNIQGVFMQVASPDQNEEKQEQELKLLVGQDLIEEKYSDIILKFSAASFMPTNTLMARRIYNRIEELAELTGKETVIDLYCGAGGVSLALARSSREVIGVDNSSFAIKDAIRNAKSNNISNVGFYEGESSNIISKLIDEKRIYKADVIVMNPPKNGCGMNTIEQIKKLEPKAVLYLSSFFSSMLKDLKSFAVHGYTPVIFEPFDTFPGTDNYEVLCYLVKN